MRCGPLIEELRGILNEYREKRPWAKGHYFSTDMDDGRGERGHFVNDLLARAQRKKVQHLPIGSLQGGHGPEYAATPEGAARIRKAKLDKPLIAIRSPEGKLHVADGNHRYMKHAAKGHTHVPVRVLDHSELGPGHVPPPEDSDN